MTFFNRRTLCGAMLTAACLWATPSDARGLAGAAAAALQRKAALEAAQKAALQGRPRDVLIRRSQHPATAAHVEHAQRHGQPTVLQIDRAGAEARRRASIGTVNRETRPAKGYDRDEYPPALTAQGGSGSSVRFIPAGDNRGAGASIRHQIRDLKDGQRIRVLITD